MKATNRTPTTLYAIVFDKHCEDKIGSAVAITSGATTELPVPSDKPSSYIESLHYFFDGEPEVIRDELIFHPDDNNRTEIKVFVCVTPKKLLPDYLENIFEITIFCPICGCKKSVDQIIVPKREGRGAASFLNTPFLCWSCHDEPPLTEDETP